MNDDQIKKYLRENLERYPSEDLSLLVLSSIRKEKEDRKRVLLYKSDPVILLALVINGFLFFALMAMGKTAGSLLMVIIILTLFCLLMLFNDLISTKRIKRSLAHISG